MNLTRLRVGAFMFMLAGFLSVSPASARTLIIGTISDEPVKEIRVFTPFARYLASRLVDDSVTVGKVVIASTVREMAELLHSGKADLYIDSPLVATLVNQNSGAKLLARRWKKGVSEYRSVIFARKERDIRTTADLGGKVIAFEEHFSSSGYLLPRIVIAQEGLPFVRKNDPEGHQVGYTFSGDDENTMQWVLYGRVDAGAMSEANFNELATESRDQLQIVTRTYSIPRHVVSHGPHISDYLAARIKTILLAMDGDEDGKSVLRQFENTTRFDEIPVVSHEQLVDANPFVIGAIEGR